MDYIAMFLNFIRLAFLRNMKIIGIVICCLGFMTFMQALLFYDISVEVPGGGRVVNLSLIEHKHDEMIISVIVFLVGVSLYISKKKK